MGKTAEINLFARSRPLAFSFRFFLFFTLSPTREPVHRVNNKHISLFLFLVYPCPSSSFHCTITRPAISCFVCRWSEQNVVISLPVIFVLKELLNGGGGGRVRCFCVGVCEGYALIDSRKLEGYDYFSQKFLK